MEEKAGRPKTPDNSLPLSKPNYEKNKTKQNKKTNVRNKQTNEITTRQDKGQRSKKKIII